MHLLVTNDDGLDSVFLHELVHALLAAGHRLLVAAPAGEQSWIGAAKTRYRPLRSRQTDRGFGCPTWSVDGTPSDCVNIALAHLLPADAPAIEGVVSGINIGRNTSLAFIIASGTIGGAWEGALHGLPAVALSQELERAQVLPPEEIPAGIVTMHSRVECVDELHDEKHSLTLVYPQEADFDKGHVSVLAPVGSALLGLSVGQSIDWTAPGGRQLRLRVTAVHYQPEAAGEFNR